MNETHHEPAIDPVCGMSVDSDAAAAAGLVAEHGDRTYHFCGRGCKLEFLDAPERFLDPGYKPSI